MLESTAADAAAKLFAATTLKGKVRVHSSLSPSLFLSDYYSLSPVPLLSPHMSPHLTLPDCLRPPPGASPTAAGTPRLYHAQPCYLPCGPQAHQTATVRVSGKPSHSDDRVEGRPQGCRQHTRHRSCHPTLRPRLSPRPPRRSHAWTKDCTHSTSARAALLSSTHDSMSAVSMCLSRNISLMLGGQEHELTMRTSELIEDNAQQALELLIRYATSSRTYNTTALNGAWR